MTVYRWLMAVLLLLGVLTPDALANRRSALSIEADYSASILVFRVGRVTLDAELGTERYTARAHVEAAGLAALFTDFSINSNVEGRFAESGPVPVNYGHIERTGDKTRIIDVDFEDGVARATASPAFSTWAIRPPANPIARAWSIR